METVLIVFAGIVVYHTIATRLLIKERKSMYDLMQVNADKDAKAQADIEELKKGLVFFMKTYRDSNPRAFSGNNTGIFKPGDSVVNPPVYDPTLIDFTSRSKYQWIIDALSK